MKNENRPRLSLQEEIARGNREDAEARDELVRQGEIKPETRYRLPFKLLKGLITRRDSTY